MATSACASKSYQTASQVRATLHQSSLSGSKKNPFNNNCIQKSGRNCWLSYCCWKVNITRKRMSWKQRGRVPPSWSSCASWTLARIWRSNAALNKDFTQWYCRLCVHRYFILLYIQPCCTILIPYLIGMQFGKCAWIGLTCRCKQGTLMMTISDRHTLFSYKTCRRMQTSILPIPFPHQWRSQGWA